MEESCGDNRWEHCWQDNRLLFCVPTCNMTDGGMCSPFYVALRAFLFCWFCLHMSFDYLQDRHFESKQVKQIILEKFCEKWLSTACNLCAQLGEPHPGDICTISSHLTAGNSKQDYFNVVLSSMLMTFLLFVSVNCFCTSCIGSWEQGHIRYIS